MRLRPILSLSLIVSLISCSGCSLWRVPTFDLNRLRDPRAVEIDSRMSVPPAEEPARS